MFNLTYFLARTIGFLFELYSGVTIQLQVTTIFIREVLR